MYFENGIMHGLIMNIILIQYKLTGKKMSHQNNVELLGQINAIYLFGNQVRS